MGEGARTRPAILCLYGDLGSGKTTFVQGFAKGLGITTRLLSPTFIIVRHYSLPADESFLCHIDLYRVKTSHDIAALGFSEIISDSKAYICVEWAEKLEGLLPEKRIDVRFVTRSNDTHDISIDSAG